MTKLEELKAALEETLMTRLEQLKAASDAADVSYAAAYYAAFDVVAADARHDAYEAAQLDWVVANDAYQAELKITQG
mgnify:CR=1 FL=1|tara:strand:+ start:364 stop:594 length:231 start_codon:yes stop_codon:yes gene_type:complete